MDSNLNTTTQSLLFSGSFIGKNEAVNGFLNIVCNLSTTGNCLITCDQSVNGTTYEFSNTFLHNVAKFGTISRSQFYVKARYIRISVLNVSNEDIPKIVLTTLYTNQNQDISLEQPASITGDVFATDLISHQKLIDIHTITSQKGDKIDATIVLSNGILDNIKSALETSITANTDKVMKATYEGTSVNVACDENGVLKSNIVVENIALTPTNDGVAIFGTSNGTNRVFISTDNFGKLQTTDTQLISKTETTHSRLTDINTSINANVLKATFNGISRDVACDDNGVLKNAGLTPQTDGVSLYGVFNSNMMALRTDMGGTLQVQDQTMLSSSAVGNGFLENIRDTIFTVTNASLASILTQTTAVKDVIIQTTNPLLTDIKARLDLINNNTQKAYLTTITISNTITILNQNTIFQTYDLGADIYRYTSITYAGTIYIGMNENPPVGDVPKVILQQSHDGTNWFSDGTEPSYYRTTAGNGGFQWEFVFQKSQISLRYARLKIDKIITFTNLNTTLSR